jgi:acyl-CoA dehydrogenase
MFAKLLKTINDAKLLPQISDTERAALEAGSVWVDGEFFSGNPDFAGMLEEAYPRLSAEEQAFVDGPVEELCHRVDTWQVRETRKVPEEIWQYLRDKGFFGLIVPKEYGGFGMSTLGRSTVMVKTATLGAVGSLIVIPNTLGAAELLIEYGTEEQKKHYLPKLAKGEYVPCFGLTEPTAGSDAASIRAEGVVFKDGDGETKIRLNFAKRYITLAPVANLVSLATRISDPENLLGKGEEPGISVVMLHKGTPGLELGDHHLPISAFDNGPIIGKDVVVPAANIVGGPEGAGQGWRMLMEQLSGGRAVSLPAGGVAACKAAAMATGPYSMVREQFGIPVGYMEGPRTNVAHIAAMAYAMESARVYVCAGVDNGHRPPVISAILKQHTTEMAQKLAIEGMDVLAGAGVMQGPNNPLSAAYTGAPVGITVEGANILTRTLIIFGQGATRCHPHALNVLHAIEENDVQTFRKSLLGWLGHTMSNSMRALVRGLTRGWSFRSPVQGPTARYYRRLAWASARFALLTDLAMFLIGGKLKQRGKLSGRYADALSWMLFGFTTLRRWEAEGRLKEDLPLVQYALDYSLARVQESFEGIYANFDVPLVGWWLRNPGRLWLRINPLSTGPSDKLDRVVAAAIQQPGAQFDRIVEYMPTPRDDEPAHGRLHKAWRLVAAAQPIAAKLHKAMRDKRIAPAPLAEAVDPALDAGVITAAEADAVRKAEAARREAIQVDVFQSEDYYRTEATATAGTDTPIAKAANA